MSQLKFPVVNGIFEVFSQVYYQLENLSQGNPPYKSVAALNCVILGCANTWDVDRAYQTFNAIDASFGLTPDVNSYNSLICAFGKLGKVVTGISLGSPSVFPFLQLCNFATEAPALKICNLYIQVVYPISHFFLAWSSMNFYIAISEWFHMLVLLSASFKSISWLGF